MQNWKSKEATKPWKGKEAHREVDTIQVNTAGVVTFAVSEA
jgi:hypothetical protein